LPENFPFFRCDFVKIMRSAYQVGKTLGVFHVVQNFGRVYTNEAGLQCWLDDARRQLAHRVVGRRD